MTNTPISIKPVNTDPDMLSLSFSKKGFGDFLSSLMTSPREERKTLKMGFDIGLSELKILVDKLNYSIKTQNDLANQALVATVEFVDGREITEFSYQGFFNREELGDSKVKSIFINLDFIVGFTRKSDADKIEEKQFEKQSVAIALDAGKPGVVVIRVKTTEFTWAPAVISTIEREIFSIARSSGVVEKQNRYLFLAPLFRTTSREGDEEQSEYLKSKLARSTSSLMTVLFCIVVYGVMISYQTSETVLMVFDESTNVISSAAFQQVLANEGWERAVQLSLLSDELLKSGIGNLSTADVWYNRALAKVSNYSSLAVLSVSLMAALFVVLCAREAKYRDCCEEGRLFMSESNRPKRSTVGLMEGVSVSILAAVASGVLASLVMSLF